jgi:hypothetical protein
MGSHQSSPLSFGLLTRAACFVMFAWGKFGMQSISQLPGMDGRRYRPVRKAVVTLSIRTDTKLEEREE